MVVLPPKLLVKLRYAKGEKMGWHIAAIATTYIINNQLATFLFRVKSEHQNEHPTTLIPRETTQESVCFFLLMGKARRLAPWSLLRRLDCRWLTHPGRGLIAINGSVAAVWKPLAHWKLVSATPIIAMVHLPILGKRLTPPLRRN
jgi:hypothetical protein